MLKRGIAPLVATMLLISFAVALGIVIMNFGRAQVNLESSCTIDIGLEFSQVSGQSQICFDAEKNDLFFVVENGVNIEVEGLIVNIIGSERAESYDLDDAIMGRAGNYLTHLGYNEELSGEIRQMKVIPIVTPFEEQVVCVEQELVVEQVLPCSS